MKFRYTVTVIHEGKEWSKNIDHVPFTIGREKADVVIPSPVISRQQLRIDRDERGIWIEDLGSRNGTYINDAELAPGTKLNYTEGTRIDIGYEQGLNIVITAKELVEKKGIELPKSHVVQEIQKVKTVGSMITIEKKAILAQPKPAPAPVKVQTPVPAPAPVEEKIDDMNSVEKKLFEQIRKMVGNEAEEIRRSSVEKAKEIETSALAEKDKILADAKAEADRILSTSHDEINQRLGELNASKNALEETLDGLQSEKLFREKQISELCMTEEQHRIELSGLEEAVRGLEEQLRTGREDFEKQREEFSAERTKFQNEYEEFKLEERKLRATLETEILEAKVKSLHVVAESARLQEQIEYLRPQLDNLRHEKQRYEEAVAEARSKVEELERVRTDLLHVQKEIDYHRADISRLEAEKFARKEEAQLFFVRAEKEAADILARTQEECRNLKNQALKDLEGIEEKKKDLRQVIEDESRALRMTHEAEFLQLVKDKTALSSEIEQRKQEAQALCVELIDEARKQCDKIRADFKNEESAARVKKEALEIEIEGLMRKRTDDIMTTKKVTDSMIAEAQAKGNVIISAAEESAAQVLTRERFLFDEEQRKAKQETEIFIETAHRNAQDILAKGEAEARENKIKQQQSLAEMKQAELFRIKELKVRGEEEIVKRKHEHAKSVSTNVYALIASEMYKAKGKVLDDTLIDEFSKGIKDLVVDTMLDRVGPDDDKLQSILKTSADAKNKEKVYWQRIKISAFACAFALMTLIAFPQIITYPRNKIVAAFTEKSDTGASEYLNQVKQARVKAVYTPKTTNDFKTSYVDNVLFTTDYLAKHEAQEFQDKWILELNDYFIKDLDVKDTTIIKFVGLESALLKDLTKMKEEIDPKNPKAGIAEMRAREQDYKKKLAEIFEDPEKVSRYYRYSDKFWKQHHNPRRPASTESQ